MVQDKEEDHVWQLLDKNVQVPEATAFFIEKSLIILVSRVSSESHLTGSGGSTRSASTANPKFAGDSNAWTHHPSEFGKIRLLRSLVFIGI